MKWLFCGYKKTKEEVFICVDDDDYEYLSTCSTFMDSSGEIPIFYDHRRNQRNVRIHKFCARSFSNADKVVHLNGNRYDNRKCNLWIKGNPEKPTPGLPPEPTYKEKQEALAHRYIIARENHKRLSAKKNPKPVYNSLGEKFNSVSEAAKAHKISATAIYGVTSGQRPHHKKIKWSFTPIQPEPNHSADEQN